MYHLQCICHFLILQDNDLFGSFSVISIKHLFAHIWIPSSSHWLHFWDCMYCDFNPVDLEMSLWGHHRSLLTTESGRPYKISCTGKLINVFKIFSILWCSDNDGRSLGLGMLASLHIIYYLKLEHHIQLSVTLTAWQCRCRQVDRHLLKGCGIQLFVGSHWYGRKACM